MSAGPSTGDLISFVDSNSFRDSVDRLRDDSGVVSVVTNDGRVIVGYLRGYDQLTNVVLTESHERVFSSESGVEQVPLGTYLVRGDNVAIVGEIDEEMDNRFDFTQMRAAPLKPTYV